MSGILHAVRALTGQPEHRPAEPERRPLKPPGSSRGHTGGRPRVPVRPGERFGKLTVLGEGPRYLPDMNGYCGRRWTCRCECGTVRDIHMGNLRRGSTTSCGCSAGEATRFTPETGKAARRAQR